MGGSRDPENFCMGDPDILGFVFLVVNICHRHTNLPQEAIGPKESNCLSRGSVCLFCCFKSKINSYGHGGTVSSPNHTFSWASLNKQLTSTSCTYFACNWQQPFLNDSAEGRRMNIEIISWSISTKVGDRAGIEPVTPVSAVRLTSVARHVTDCPTQPGEGGSVPVFLREPIDISDFPGVSPLWIRPLEVCFIHIVMFCCCIEKPVFSGHLWIDKTKDLKTNGNLMKVESIAECSPWSILQYFWPALRDTWYWKPILVFFLSGRLKVLWIFKNIFGTLHDLNDIGEKTKMLKTPS